MKKKWIGMIMLVSLLLLQGSLLVWAEETTSTTESSQTSSSSATDSTQKTESITKAIKTPQFTTVNRKSTGKTSISWGKVSGASGYQIQYATRSDFSDAKSVKVSKSATSKKIASLPTKKDSYLRMRAYKTASGKTSYTAWSATARLIVWKTSWKYAKNSKIHKDPVVLYYSPLAKSKQKNITIAVNAGHGCKGGSSKKTLCHPNGSKKVTGGSTSAGAKYATAINEGTSLKSGSEASANLKIAKRLKKKLLAAGYNVLMIRQDSNTQLDNIARTVMANKNADCHIAIHFDSTSSNKGAFAISVPAVSSYRKMQPVKSHWKQHNKLGKSLISGLKSAKVKIFGSGSMAIDLTQTSYSTIPSVDIEVGDRATSTSSSNLNKIAKGLLKGIEKYY